MLLLLDPGASSSSWHHNLCRNFWLFADKLFHYHTVCIHRWFLLIDMGCLLVDHAVPYIKLFQLVPSDSLTRQHFSEPPPSFQTWSGTKPLAIKMLDDHVTGVTPSQ